MLRFRNASESFDGRGNYSLGITDQMIFPEIEYDKGVRSGCSAYTRASRT